MRTLLTIFMLFTSAPVAHAGFIESCRFKVKRFFGDPAIFASDTKEVFSHITPEMRDSWLSTVRNRPEAVNRMSEAQALAILRSVTLEDLKGAKRVSDGLSEITLPSGHSVIIRESYTKHDLGEGRATSFYRKASHDVIASAIDHLIDTRVAPPSIALKTTLSLQLKVNSVRSISFPQFSTNLRNLMVTSHIKVLDKIVGNFDRPFNNNLLVANNGQAIAHDYDVSLPGIGPSVERTAIHLRVEGVRVKGFSTQANSLNLPIVVHRRVYDGLGALNSRILIEEVRARGLELSQTDADLYVAMAHQIYHAIELEQQNTGVDLIIDEPTP